MKRKLISYDAFARIELDSLSNAEHELCEASDILSRTLNKGLSLRCFGESNVIYETDEGTFISATYNIDRDHINFNNLEEVVIDEASRKEASKNTIAEMLEAILEDESAKAQELFSNFLEAKKFELKGRAARGMTPGRKSPTATDKFKTNNPANKNEQFTEAKAMVRVSAPSGVKNAKKSLAAKKGWRSNKGSILTAQKRSKARHKGILANAKKSGTVNSNKKKAAMLSRGGKRARLVVRVKDMKEWNTVSSNILEYCNFMNDAPVIRESVVNTSRDGDVVAVRIPLSKLRTEAKLLSLKWDTMKTDIKILRESAMSLVRDPNFCKAVASVKRFNNVSDDNGLEEAINNVVINWPSIVYLTQEELSKSLSKALELVGESNYDDQICTFMAEGLLRVAHEVHSDRVSRIASLANMKIESDSTDPYLDFQSAASGFFSELDESMAVQSSVFEDLHDALTTINNAANESEHDQYVEDTEIYLSEIEKVLKGEVNPSLELAEEVSEWIRDLVDLMEAEMASDSTTWDVVKTPHRSENGDHPDMAKNAKVSGIPSANLGDWGAEAPALDDEGGTYRGGKGAKQMKSSWATRLSAGPDTYPELDNPYIPKPFGDYTMKGEKGVDKDMDSPGMFQSNDTWPNLQNPYIPKGIKVHVNSDNRVDDVENRVGLNHESNQNRG